MKKKFILVSMLLAAVLMFTACTKNEEKGTNNATKEVVDSTDKEFKIGTIQFANHIALDRSREGFLEALDENGIKYTEDLVNCQGDISLTTTSAQKMASANVDLIYTIATPAAQGAKNVVKDIPIIFSAVTDPVASELVADKDKPGENITGVSDYFPSDKQLDTFIKLFPEIKTIGVLYSTDEANSQVQIEELKKNAEKLNIKVEVIGVNNINDVPQAMTSLVDKIDGYFAITDNLASNAATIIGNILVEKNIPSISAEEGPVENGLLFTDGIDYKDLGKKAGEMAVSILKEGKNPGDIPVLISEDSKKVVNAEVAKKLGISEDSELFKDAKLVNN